MKDFIYIIHLMYLLNKERIYHMINDINKKYKIKKIFIIMQTDSIYIINSSELKNNFLKINFSED